MGEDLDDTSLPMPARRHERGASHSSHEPVSVRMERDGPEQTLVFTTPDGKARLALDQELRRQIEAAGHADGDRLALRVAGAASTWSVLKDDVAAFVAADDRRVENGWAGFNDRRAAPGPRAAELVAAMPHDRHGRVALRVARADLEPGAAGPIAALVALAVDAVAQPGYARDGASGTTGPTGAVHAGREGVEYLRRTYGVDGARRCIRFDAGLLTQALDDGVVGPKHLADAKSQHEAVVANERGGTQARGGRDVER